MIRNKVLGVCHFGGFYEAMDAAQHLVKLRPIAVALIDRTMLGPRPRDRDVPLMIEATVQGDPTPFCCGVRRGGSGREPRRLKQLSELMADLGFGWNNPKRKWGGVVDIVEPARAGRIAEFRAAGLNVMMSMKQEGKPVSFVEDARCRCPTSPTIPNGSTPYSPNTAPAAPCMRMPPKAACMSAPS